MPTLKAEFLAHHYARRLRPRTAYAFGPDRPLGAARLAIAPARERAHADARALARSRRRPPASRSNAAAAVRERRRCSDWFAGAPARRRRAAPRVLLWPDTFTNHFEPRRRRRRGRVLERGRLRGHRAAAAGSAAAGRSTTTASSTPARRYLERIARRAARRDPRRHAARRGRAELRRRVPRRAAEAAAARRGRQAACRADASTSPSSSRADAIGCDAAAARAARCSSTATATPRATGGVEPERGAARADGRPRSRRPTPAAAAWRALGATRPRTTTSRRPAASARILPAVREAAGTTPSSQSGFSCRKPDRPARGRPRDARRGASRARGHPAASLGCRRAVSGADARVARQNRGTRTKGAS